MNEQIAEALKIRLQCMRKRTEKLNEELPELLKEAQAIWNFWRTKLIWDLTNDLSNTSWTYILPTFWSVNDSDRVTLLALTGEISVEALKDGCSVVWDEDLLNAEVSLTDETREDLFDGLDVTPYINIRSHQDRLEEAGLLGGPQRGNGSLTNSEILDALAVLLGEG